MGTVSSVLSSAASLTSGPLTSSSSSYFSGVSTYSGQLQEVIGRAVAIASLPIELLTNQQTTLTGQATELNTLDGNFTTLQSSIQTISDAMGGSGMNSSVSNPSVASVTLGDGAAQGAYTINVSSIGAYATSLTNATWNNIVQPGGQTTTYNLVVGAHTYSFTPADNSAGTVASTINAQFGNLVQATAVNVGSASSPDYRISLQSSNLGPMDLDIQTKAGANLQTSESAASGYASSMTDTTWDSSGNPSTFTLAVDGANFTISPVDNSAASVASAINGLAGSPVRATVVNEGTDSNPDERIQLQSTSAGVSNVDLLDSSGDSLQAQATPGAAGSGVSQTSWTWDPTPDPSGNSTQYTLTVGSETQTFVADDNSAAGVAAAINSLAGSPVTATVVDMGTASSPDYRLQLTDNTASGDSPQLTRSTAFNLQDQGPAGSLAQYEIANSGVTVTSASRQVSIAAGTTLTLSGTGSTNVVVTQSIATLNTALSGFADAYNATVAELAKQYGQAGGALQGHSIIYSLSRALSQMSTFSNSASGSIGLADLGFTLNNDGTLTYSPLTMMSTDLGNSAGVISFLGSATGGGFLQAATNAIANIETPTTGLLKSTESALQSQITSIGVTVAQKQAQVGQLQTSLTNQMAQADATLAQMQQQYSYITSVFQAQQTADQMLANGQ
ncbi:MAG TPA: flagellar filament capping protein FliD [Bryobacteraceae bacterium]|jgi:flagellar capping protein FliD|nr:flagellar filament capping protein FliD [Bryobacteraceae bacterium]